MDVWERFDAENILVELGSDQTSLHNPWAGGYYPVGLSFEESNQLMAENPEAFKVKVQESLRRQATAINRHTAKELTFSIMVMLFFAGSFPCRCGSNGRKRDRFPVSKLCAGYFGANVF
ncbi:hypothetical protein [Algoriphagus boritolerans]|uniref:hypothetical protein n=1 Tax=Algoriphagus boritolerans TaxID=308111 RepID=UPI000A95E6A5